MPIQSLANHSRVQVTYVPMKWLAPLLVPLLVATVAFGCGGDDGESPLTSPASTPEATGEAMSDVTPNPQATATPEVTPAAPSPATEPAVDAAIAAALANFDAVSDADCQTNNPQNRNCAGLSSQPSTVQLGIAVFGVGPPDGGGFVGVLGLDQAGEWKFWRASQQDYQLLALPGDALVCAYGSGLNVRSEPTTDAPAVGTIEDLAGVRAEEFVLTEQGSDDQQQHGYGWFRLSSPLAGWAYSKYLTAAGWDDCSLHDALEPES